MLHYNLYLKIVKSTNCDPTKVTQLTNVTTQYGMTSTQNAYMWMFGFAGDVQGSPKSRTHD